MRVNFILNSKLKIGMDKLRKHYENNIEQIKNRLNDFKKFYNKPVSWFYDEKVMVLRNTEINFNERIFEELSFCLLTANTSAAMAMKAIDYARPVLSNGSFEDIQTKLINAGYRYPNKRAEYIYENREKIKNEYDFDFSKIFNFYDNPIELREFFVNYIKGFGYKEASHFLRNIGFFGLTILDKHILRTMHEYGYLDDIPKSLNKKRYLETEKKFIRFSNDAGINVDDMDIVLWSMKSGNIMK